MGYFTISAKNKLNDLEIGTKINESDFATLTPEGTFVQLVYVEEDDTDVTSYDVHPGVYTIQKTMTGLKLEKTSFVKDAILDEFVSTVAIEAVVDSFIRNIPLYKEFGFEVAKRSALLWGPPGCGKTTAIAKMVDKYTINNEMTVVIWPTDKFESHVVKDFIKSFKYQGTKILLLIAEDLGGTEMEETRFRSDSSLLSLLDNQEKTFTIPTLILATTNYPQSFLANIANRPGRFEDKIKVDYPPKEARSKLLAFFSKGQLDEDTLKLIESDKCKEFTPAHIKEVYVRSRLRELPIKKVIEEVLKEIELFKKSFDDKKGNLGF